MIGGPQVMSGKDSARSPAHGVDDVDRTGRSGDDPSLVVVDARGAYVSVDRDTRAAPDHDAMYAGISVGWIRPVRCRGIGEPVDVLHSDHRVAAAEAVDAESHGRDLAGLDPHHRALNRYGRDPLLDSFADLVKLDAEIDCQAAHLGAPHRREHTGQEHHRSVVCSRPETETDTGEFGVIIASVVE